MSHENVDEIKVQPAPIYLTIRPEAFLPDQFENRINMEEIRSLIGSKNNRQDENSKVENLLKDIKFLILQLATFKTFSKKQDFNDDFDQQEKDIYNSFFKILKDYNLDLENVSEAIIENIATEYEN